MLDQFFRPISTTPKNPKSFQKPDDNKDKKPEEVKIRKAIEIKFHQNALPEEFPAVEEYPVTREYHRTDSNDYPLHRIGYYWPVNNFIPNLN